MEERITAIIAAVGGICWLAACLFSLTLPDLDSPIRNVLVALGGLLLGLAAVGLGVCIVMSYHNRGAAILSGLAFFSILAGGSLLGFGVFTMVAGFISPELAKESRFIAVGAMAVGLAFMTAVTIRLRVGLSWVVVPLWIGTASAGHRRAGRHTVCVGARVGSRRRHTSAHEGRESSKGRPSVIELIFDTLECPGIPAVGPPTRLPSLACFDPRQRRARFGE
jgi:hypothetical protein